MSDARNDILDSWSETMTARERVRAVAETLHEPRSTNWISEQADASWSTANEELRSLVERGRLRQNDAGDATLYQPDYARLLFDELRRLIEENSREELRDELAVIAEEIEGWRSEYDVETWEELEGTLSDPSLASTDIRERRDVVGYWRENEQDRRLLRHALELFADVEDARELTDKTLSGAPS